MTGPSRSCGRRVLLVDTARHRKRAVEPAPVAPHTLAPVLEKVDRHPGLRRGDGERRDGQSQSPEEGHGDPASAFERGTLTTTVEGTPVRLTRSPPIRSQEPRCVARTRVAAPMRRRTGTTVHHSHERIQENAAARGRGVRAINQTINHIEPVS